MTNQKPHTVIGTPPLQMALLGFAEDEDSRAQSIRPLNPAPNSAQSTSSVLVKEDVVRRIIQHLNKEP